MPVEGIPTPQQPTHLGTSNRKLLFLALAIVLLIVGALAVRVFLHKNKTTAPAAQGTVSSQVSTATAESQQRAVVDANIKSTVPAVANSSVIEQTALPSDIAQFILPGAIGTVASSASFADGSSGYKIIYSAPGTAPSVSEKIASMPSTSQQPFSLLTGANTNLAATFEEQSVAYTVRVDTDTLTPSTSRVTVTVVVRK